MAAFKASFLNEFVEKHAIQSVLEFGCGDGRQLALARYARYTGLDVSATAVLGCIDRFRDDPSKSFFLYHPNAFVDRARTFHADLTVSLDVILHLLAEDDLVSHLQHLFSAADRYVVVFSTDEPLPDPLPHVRHRRWTPWVRSRFPDWTLVQEVANPEPYRSDPQRSTPARFFVFGRAAEANGR